MRKVVITFIALGASLIFSSAQAIDDKDTAIGTLINGLGTFKVTTDETRYDYAAPTKNADDEVYNPALTFYVDTLSGGRFDRYGYEYGFKGYYPYEQPSKFSVGYSSGYGDGSASHDYGAYGYNDALYQRLKQYRKEKRNR
ncbi:MAG: hypothetical protein COA84_10315 [Robiginitomaculum sp.]|nr:MAG: hypothetical protein COA84_10315 [Robiginitomaculum sp.]